jgi:tetratricopeptide (TPR) repeat protein
MIALDPILLLVLTTCLYILVFGGLSLLRREGLSVQFALEAIVVSIVLIGGSWLTGIRLSPFVLLILLYLVTMRSRLLVDIANMLAQRRRYDLAVRLYRWALAWWPDATSRLIVQVNWGAAELLYGHIDAAIGLFEGVLEAEKRPRLGLKYEAACHYNLGYAYEKKGEDAKAAAQYNEAIELLPGSLYAKAAQAALKRRKDKGAAKEAAGSESPSENS